jgi:hypothetical protein
MRTVTPILFALFAVLILAASPGSTEERACRPSLSNLWHCPGDTNAQPKAKPATTERACRPSLSNGYHCPGTAAAPEPAPVPKRTVHEERACKPSLSNGFHCPGQAASNEEPSPRKATPREERGCRPSLSNGYKCGPTPSASTETPLGKGEYATEADAAAHCPRDTVVWLNSSTGIYHYAGTRWYGNTKSGAYMCEGDSVNDGMRPAKNEDRPHT